MKPKKIALKLDEHIVAVVPDYCCGPGWSNAPVWVHIVDSSGKYRKECIQPGERTADLHRFFNIGNTVCFALRDAVPTKRAK